MKAQEFAAGSFADEDWQPCPNGRHQFSRDAEHVVKLVDGFPVLAATHYHWCSNDRCNWALVGPCDHTEAEREQILAQLCSMGR